MEESVAQPAIRRLHTEEGVAQLAIRRARYASELTTRRAMRRGHGHVVKLRLNGEREEALRFLFCDFSGICGLRSSHGAQMDALNNPRGGGSVGTYSEIYDQTPINLYVPDRWLLQYPAKFRDRVNGAMRCLRALEAAGNSKHAVVLYLVYGPRNHERDWQTFGELAQLVHMTPMAVEMAQKATEKLREAMATGISQTIEYERKIVDVTASKRSSLLAMAEEKRHERRAEEDEAKRVKLGSEICELRERAAMVATRLDTVRATATMDTDPQHIAERMSVTVSPREVLAYLHPDQKGKHFTREARDGAIAAIRREADQMLIDACSAYVRTVRSLEGAR